MAISQTNLHFLTSLLLVSLYNTAFFQRVASAYPVNWSNAVYLFSVGIGMFAVIMLLLTLIGWRHTSKPVLALLLPTSAGIAYFSNNYNVVIDHTMIRNIVQTNWKEAADLFTFKLAVYLLLLGLLPAFFVCRAQLTPVSWKKEILTKAKITFLCVLTFFGLFALSSNFFFSFFREHATLRLYANPLYPLYSVSKFVRKTFAFSNTSIHPLGTDAHVPASDTDRELVILVVGEAVRADHFSLNGYSRLTNPLLQQEEVISFANMYSSGTATAFSVPCMFSIYPREECNEQKATATENLLDVLQHAGVHVLWRDNNSDSKGVALRIPYQDFRQPVTNSVCDTECRDEGMLAGLQEYIDSNKEGDIVIVLHQMGNHGPAYFKRYPPAFEQFTPVCATNQLHECSREEIANAYDNAILYTDAFLNKVITLLKNNSGQFETAMVYMGDHGESLGEYGVYLHGLPYAVAPDSQKHVASIFWFGDSFRIDKQIVRARAVEHFSHDNLFHTVLGLLEIESSIYNPQLDITSSATGHDDHTSAVMKTVQQRSTSKKKTPQRNNGNNGMVSIHTADRLRAVLPLFLMLKPVRSI